MLSTSSSSSSTLWSAHRRRFGVLVLQPKQHQQQLHYRWKIWLTTGKYKDYYNAQTRLLTTSCSGSGGCINKHDKSDNIILCYSRSISSSSSSRGKNIQNTSIDQTLRPHRSVVLPKPTWSVESLGLDVNHKPVDWSEYVTLCKRAVLNPIVDVVVGAIGTQENSQSNDDNNNNDNDNDNNDNNAIINNGDSRSQRLRQDLGNMLHMIEQVQQPLDLNQDHQSNTYSPTVSYEDMYDLPRGVQSAPIQYGTCFPGGTRSIQHEEQQRMQTTIHRMDGDVVEAGKEQQLQQKRRMIDKLHDDNVDRSSTASFPSFVQTKLKEVGGHKYFIAPTACSSSSSLSTSKTTTKATVAATSMEASKQSIE